MQNFNAAVVCAGVLEKRKCMKGHQKIRNRMSSLPARKDDVPAKHDRLHEDGIRCSDNRSVETKKLLAALFRGSEDGPAVIFGSSRVLSAVLLCLVVSWWKTLPGASQVSPRLPHRRKVLQRVEDICLLSG